MNEELQAYLDESRAQQRARRAQQLAQGAPRDLFVEVTATQMDPAWIVFDPGDPGTLAEQRGGSWWCVRCLQTDFGRPGFDISHVCPDIVSGGRRWVAPGLAPQIAEIAGRERRGDEPQGEAERLRPACTRCSRPYDKNDADAARWNMVLRDGHIVAVLCPGCQSREEDLEAQVNQATLRYQADDQGRIWNRPNVSLEG